MESKHIWQLFMDTGAPEFYMLFNKARKAEGDHVSYDPGTGAESHTVQ